jgi:hypothetical protein
MATFVFRARASVSSCVNVLRKRNATTPTAWTSRLAWLGAKCSVSTIRVSRRLR